MRTAYMRFCLHFVFPLPVSQTVTSLYATFLAPLTEAYQQPRIFEQYPPHSAGGGPTQSLWIMRIWLWSNVASADHSVLRPTKNFQSHHRSHTKSRPSQICRADTTQRSGVLACLLAFYTFLCKSSPLPKCSRSPSHSALCRSDLVIGGQMVYITVPHSKTIQFGQRVMCLPISGQPGSVLCPLAATLAMLQDYLVVGSLPAAIIMLPGYWKSNAYGCYVTINNCMNAECTKALSLPASSL